MTVMRLVSANIKVEGLSARWGPLVGRLAAVEADVLALQEVPSPEEGERLATDLGMDIRLGPAPSGLHTAILRRPELEETAWDDKYAARTWHGFAAQTVVGPGWPVPITIISAHLVPHSTQAAIPEAQLLASRVRRQGCPGIIAGDINHPPVGDPEPPWDEVPAHNRSARTVLDDGPVRADQRVGWVLEHGDLVDVAAHLAEVRGDAGLRAPTGVYGRMRVDQVHVTEQLVPALVDYCRLDHQEVSDHHPVAVELDLDAIVDTTIAEWH